MPLIALCGFISSGKNSAARFLVEEHGYYDIAFADALKDALAAIFHWPRDGLEGLTPQSRAWRNEVDEWWAKRLGIPHFTPRWAMQNVGTDLLRRHLNDDLWLLNVERKMDALKARVTTPKIALVDSRFTNELDMARRNGGRVVRVKRGPEPDWWETALRANTADSSTVRFSAKAEMDERGIHVSEWAWIGYRFDRVIENEGSLDDLREAVARFA